MEMILAIIGILVVVSVAATVAIVILRRRAEAQIENRLDQFTESTMTLEEIELQQPFYQRVIVPVYEAFLSWLGQFSPQRSAEKVRKNLQQAGNPGNITPTMFGGMRIALAVILFVLFGLVTLNAYGATFNAFFYTALGGAIGYVLPGIWLDRQMKKRKKNITKALPDALDLLTISVEAGLGFDVALQRVSEKWDDELSREFRRVLSDVRLGRSRREALRDMADRTGVEDVQTFVAAVIQADQLGVPMSKILRLQSDQMRTKRRQRAEEEAQKAPIKMLFPMVFLIFPALFVVILGPAVPRMFEAFGGL